MRQFRYVLLFLVLAFLGGTLLAYSEETVEQSNRETNTIEQLFEEQNLLQSLIGPILIILAAVLIIAAVVYVIFHAVRQWKTMHEIIQYLPSTLQSVQNVNSNNANSIKKIEVTQTSILNSQEKIENYLVKTNTQINYINTALQNLKTDTVIDDEEKHTLIDHQQVEERIDYQQVAEREVTDAEQKILELESAYKDGEPIDLVNIETLTPSQNVLMILNLIASDLGEWKTELEQSTTVNTEFVQILTNAEKDIKNKLKVIRGEHSPIPTPLDVDSLISSDIELDRVRNECIAHVACFKGILSGFELGHEVDETEYNQFIPQFIRYRLFNEIADFVSFNKLPERMDRFLIYLGYEVVPIEIGKTKVDARVHDIRDSRQTSGEPGTIIEVILPGLQRIEDGEIVQKPIVIRGE